MYCRTLQYRDGHGRFSITVEERPDGSLQIWELDVPGGEARRLHVIEEVAGSLSREGRGCMWSGARRGLSASAPGTCPDFERL